MRTFFLLLLSSFSTHIYCQFAILPYNVVRDSLTHISVFHSGNTEKVRLSSQQYLDTLSVISPDIRMKNGVVDHKSLTGDMLVREYYNDSVMIGYIEFYGADSKRELYFYSNGNVFLEKYYDKGQLIYMNDKVRIYFIKTTYP